MNRISRYQCQINYKCKETFHSMKCCTLRRSLSSICILKRSNRIENDFKRVYNFDIHLNEVRRKKNVIVMFKQLLSPKIDFNTIESLYENLRFILALESTFIASPKHTHMITLLLGVVERHVVSTNWSHTPARLMCTLVADSLYACWGLLDNIDAGRRGTFYHFSIS